MNYLLPSVILWNPLEMNKRFSSSLVRGYDKRWNRSKLGFLKIESRLDFLSFENEVRPGMVMTVAAFFYFHQVHPSFMDMIVNFDHSVWLGPVRTRTGTYVNETFCHSRSNLVLKRWKLGHSFIFGTPYCFPLKLKVSNLRDTEYGYNYPMRFIGCDSIQIRWLISYRFQIHTMMQRQYKRIGAINRTA